MTEIRNLNPAFQHDQYLFRKKVLKLFGGAFHVYDERGDVVFFSKQKAFKLKEDIRVYSDESQNQELLKISTPQIIDYETTYNVRDVTTGESVGALRRKGFRSFIKDEWKILSSTGQEIGKLTEISMMAALLSRYINLIPQTYIVLSSNSEVAKIKQDFNPFVLKYTMTIKEKNVVDPRLLIAAGILLAAIERRQD